MDENLFILKKLDWSFNRKSKRSQWHPKIEQNEKLKQKLKTFKQLWINCGSFSLILYTERHYHTLRDLTTIIKGAGWKKWCSGYQLLISQLT